MVSCRWRGFDNFYGLAVRWWLGGRKTQAKRTLIPIKDKPVEIGSQVTFSIPKTNEIITVTQIESPQQNDTWSCGIWTVANAKAIEQCIAEAIEQCKAEEKTLTKENIINKAKELYQDIKSSYKQIKELDDKQIKELAEQHLQNTYFLPIGLYAKNKIINDTTEVYPLREDFVYNSNKPEEKWPNLIKSIQDQLAKPKENQRFYFASHLHPNHWILFFLRKQQNENKPQIFTMDSMNTSINKAESMYAPSIYRYIRWLYETFINPKESTPGR